MKKIKCCVLMSTYNGAKFISEQIASILNQKDVDLMLVVRDDGSSDETISLLEMYQKKYPDNIILVCGENKGIHGSFYELIKLCPESDYVAFADQDDYWDENKIFCAISQLESNNADFYSSASRLCDNQLHPLDITTSNKKSNEHYMKKDNCILTPGTQGCTIVLTKKFFDFLKTHDIPDNHGHDTWITIVAYYFVKCIYDDQPHMLYRQHDNSWTGNRTNKIKQFIKEMNFFLNGMERYSKLAEDILIRFENELPSESIELLKTVSKGHKSLEDKLKLIFEKNFNKFGTIRNMVFKICILFGRV